MPPVPGSKSKYMVQIEWGDVPHLNETAMAKILASTPPYLRGARSRGDPALGSGVIYPVDLEDVLVNPFLIPGHWPRWYGLDVGIVCTAAMWHAYNPDEDRTYLYAEHYRGGVEASVHAHAIMERGDWIPGVIDPAARGRNPKDGKRLIDDYRDMGLRLTEADNAVSAGIDRVWEMLSDGRYKVFRTCQNWQKEYRVYRRDDKGKIIKKDDHAMDSSRYAIMTPDVRIIQPKKKTMTPTKGPADATAGY